jgi:hypothetical protein
MCGPSILESSLEAVPQVVKHLFIVAGFLFSLSVGLWMLAFVRAIPKLIEAGVLKGLKGESSERL